MRTSRSSTTVMTASSEVQTREEATEHVKQLDLFVTVMLLKKHRQFSHMENSAKIMGILTPLDQWSETTSHQTWQEN